MILFLGGCVSERPTSSLAYESQPDIGLCALESDGLSAALLTLKNEIKTQYPEASVVDKSLVRYENQLEDIRRRLDEGDAYLARHPSSSSYYSGDLSKGRQEYIEAQKQYDSLVKFYEPYRSEGIVEKRKQVVRGGKYRELILNYTKILGIPESNLLVADSCMFYVDRAVFKSGLMTIDSHFAIFPDCRAEIDSVHADFKGQGLGRVNTKIGRTAIDQMYVRSAGINIPCTHEISVEDMNMPSSGIISLLVTAGGVSKTIEVSYTGEQGGQVISGDTITLMGRRKGAHIMLPVKFETQGVVSTRDCIVDTGATITTVPQSVSNFTTTRKLKFSTANGDILSPVGTSTVSVGGITREIEVARSESETVNLLGANFFDGYIYTIDLERASISLIKR